MSLIQRLSNSLFVKPKSLINLVTVFSIFGTLFVLCGGVWDASSHALKEPEYFWTMQHVSVYFGVSLISSAATIGIVLIRKNHLPKKIQKGVLLVIISSIILIISGFGDSMSHEIFGIDGLISWSHQPLEFGLVLASLGGFYTFKSLNTSKLTFLEPISIVTVLLSASWLGFNLILFIGATIQCIPVYEIFSSGCAIL